MKYKLLTNSLLTFIILIHISYQMYSEDISCKLFPSNNIWNTAIDELPLHPNSSVYINNIGISKNLHPDFGSGLWNGAPIGIPFVNVNATQPKIKVIFDYAEESDIGPYPIPQNPPIEGGENSNGDRHILIIDNDNCFLYELYYAFPNNDGTWRAGSGAIFDLNKNELRTDTWTSADAAGLPILPGLVRYDEIEKGEINHAIRFTVSKTQRKYLWPARHYASTITDPAYPPMGLRVRLKKSFDISSFSKTNKIILTALKKYGLILADNGSDWFFSGVPDIHWDDEDLSNLKKIKGADFEAVDVSSIMINNNSAEAKQLTSFINEEISNESILHNNNIFPNPVDDFLYLQFTKPSQKIEIYSLEGSKIFETEFLEIIDVRNFLPGLYFIKLNNQFFKFIKI